ncbi:MAG: nitroreductase family protein [Acidobacteria bacterium]|nr:nitroreductase family protein [Acidobacteriota bacterium]
MYYKKSIDELIKKRFSCRIFQEKRIEQAKLKELNEYCALLKEGLAGEPVKFQLIELSDDEIRKIDPDDFSLVINPITFIGGAIRKSRLAYESYGYLLEQLVLKATEMGLATCWLGYFNSEYFQRIELAADEILPAVCVVGYAAEKGSSSGRKKWESLFFIKDFKTSMSAIVAGNYAEPLDMLRMAPSAGNLQPWRIVKEKNKNVFHFYKKRLDREYERRKLHNVDIGIAMCHFELGAKKNELEGTWEKMKETPIPVPERTEYIISWVGKL